VNVIPVLNKLAEGKFLGRKAFVIARLVREINKESETFELTRIELIKKYAEKDEKGELIITDDGNVHISTENLTNCNEELLKLQNTKIEINAEKIPVDWLEEMTLTLTEASILEPFVQF
jgi:hypothetical protein